MDDPGPKPPVSSLNLNIRGMGHSATVAINERSNQLRREGRTVHKLGLGQSPFPVPERVVESLRQNAHVKDYLPVAGLQELRDAVAAYTERTAGVSREGDDVLVGPGSKELMFLLQLVYYGDLVIPTPAWVSYAPQARILGRNVRFMQTRREDQWMLTAEAFEALCQEDPDRPRVVILNYPSNPTGATFTGAQLEEL
ncbi:MAG: aminotransferase class I/II-fold pyridoxal phosphate-dependent enzyme, partial [Deltaproteobacteria bacterium]|nr:aminotransferase class I/II-fold pyridoxal phosphate-dependent enzyme [Deltaproteobacteria bacterium]